MQCCMQHCTQVVLYLFIFGLHSKSSGSVKAPFLNANNTIARSRGLNSCNCECFPLKLQLFLQNRKYFPANCNATVHLQSFPPRKFCCIRYSISAKHQAEFISSSSSIIFTSNNTQITPVHGTLIQNACIHQSIILLDRC